MGQRGGRQRGAPCQLGPRLRAVVAQDAQYGTVMNAQFFLRIIL
jgi:hypothetical protein